MVTVRGDPATLLGWHRRLVRRHRTSPSTAPARSSVPADVQAVIVRLATENPGWGYPRIAGELAGLGARVSASSVRRVLLARGIHPAPRRDSATGRSFLRQQAAGIIACDFFTVDSVWLTRYDVPFFIEIDTRRVHLAGITTNPTGEWVTQQARNLAAAVDDRTWVARYLVRDRDAKLTRSLPFARRAARQRRRTCTAPESRSTFQQIGRTARFVPVDARPARRKHVPVDAVIGSYPSALGCQEGSWLVS